MNLMQSQQKPFQKRDPAQSYQPPALCCWRNQCLSPRRGIWAVSHSIGYKEVTKILTTFSIFKSSRGCQKCLVCLYLRILLKKKSVQFCLYSLVSSAGWQLLNKFFHILIEELQSKKLPLKKFYLIKRWRLFFIVWRKSSKMSKIN